LTRINQFIGSINNNLLTKYSNLVDIINISYLYFLRLPFLKIDKSLILSTKLKVTALKKLWKNKVPSKVSIFGWRLLLEKLPTREVLFQRGVITNIHETCCVFCFDLMESIDHIFLTCRVTATVWSLIFVWMGIQGSSARNIQQHFLWFGDLLKGKHSKRVKHIIWLATMWSLWRTRNNIIFRGDFVNVQSLVDQIIYISWFWFISRVGTNVNFVFSDWCNNPLKCLHSTICRSL
jgi:hypothetical protein